ncbi:MAG: thiazole synthase [Phycisphaerales bacterium]|nr:thiazole synthase [Phycisphaerales bacterium]
MTASDVTPLTVGPFTLDSRLIVGTGKYETWDVMADALDASGASAITVAVRRERLLDDEGRSLLDAIDLSRYIVLPNTAGCFDAADAIRVARLGRELLSQVDNPGAQWVKLEVLGDKATLLPDPVGTLEACKELVADGFSVLCYTSDDPIMAVRLRDAGATSVMPAGSPIGSGRGIANPASIRIIHDLLKDPAMGGDPEYPLIVDAGVGTPSDVTLAMELGADGVLLNTGIAHAKHPVQMAHAMRLACDSGWHGYRAGRISTKLYASASSPWTGTINVIPGE